MIKWGKIEAGEYKSEDGRFHILKTWDRVYGDHWQLLDRNADDYYKGLYHENTLLDCKLKAEAIIYFMNGDDDMPKEIELRTNLDWAGEFQTMAERMRLCESEEQMYKQLQKFKEEFNSEYGKLSRTQRSRTGFRWK